MAYVFKKRLAHRSNYGAERPLGKIKYIVIHYTANDGDSDEGNGNYFAEHIIKASAHYFVDGDSITQSVPDNYIAYSVGGNKWSDCNKTGGGKLYGQCNNSNSISIELCDEVKNGNSDFTESTLENAIDLIRQKMKEYDIGIDRVIRHFDVNGKPCPKPFVDKTVWNNFKQRILANGEDLTMSQYEELKKEIEGLKAKNKALESIVGSLYKTEEEIPVYYKSTIKPLIEKGAIKGTGDNLNLPEIIARTLVIINRDKSV